MPRPLPSPRRRAVLVVLVVLLGIAGPRRPGAAEPGGPQPALAAGAALPDASRPPVVTEHSIRVADRALAYRAEAGMLPLLKEDGTPRAHVFFVAYTLAGDGDAAERPLLFCFNGGPGAAAVWLHLGGLGPRRALVNADGSLPPPPFTLVDNEHTILPTADLVFVDPVATGYSRAAKDEKPEQFFGTERDVAALAEFVRLYTTRQRRWRSPKYLCGESYGVFRVAGLAAALHDQGMFLNGLVLVSGLVDFGTISPGPSNDLPYALFLPTMTAVAHHHGRLPADLQADRRRALAESRAFARGEYVTALFAGAALPAARRQAVAERIARLTGLPAAVVLDRDLRVDTATFREKLLADRGLVCGRFDGRITGRDGAPGRERPRFDPSFDAALGPLAAAMNAYVREELRFESDLPYHVLTGVSPWSHEENAYSSTAPQLAEVLARNPHLRVLVQAGLCDLAVPASSLPHSVDHLELDAALRGNVRYAEYEAGHMMYLHGPDLAKFHADLRGFLLPPPAAR